MNKFLTIEPYIAPSWISSTSFKQIPKQRYRFAQLPTPIYKLKFSQLPEDFELYIKRDDMTGMTLSGNKVRKLEFIMADVILNKKDSIITIGGIQSNHCRAAAVVSRYLGLDCHLILRNSAHLVDSDPGLIGNLLVNRMTNATIHQVTKEEYRKHGSLELTNTLAKELESKGKKPYQIPVGGSNALGTWGYLNCFDEIIDQSMEITSFTDIITACGSGGTVAGLCLGAYLNNKMKIGIHAYIVCDDEEYFYNFINSILKEMGNFPDSRQLFRAIQAKGAGYAISKPEELNFIKEFAHETGIILDPVYSGKALYNFIEDVEKEPEKWKNKKALFLHTGGLLGLYDKLDELEKVIKKENCERLTIE